MPAKTRCQDNDTGLAILGNNVWWCNSCKEQLTKVTMLEHVVLNSHRDAVVAHADAVRRGAAFGGPLAPPAPAR